MTQGEVFHVMKCQSNKITIPVYTEREIALSFKTVEIEPKQDFKLKQQIKRREVTESFSAMHQK